MAPKDTKIWNEDLVDALRMREDLARREGKQNQITWKQGAEAIESVRKDIYAFKNGRIVGLPSSKLKTTVDNLCREIIAGTKPIVPPGYVPTTQVQVAAAGNQNPYENYPYLKRMKIRGGAFAILMAFYVAGDRHNMTKDQICRAAQPFCDEAMEENYHAGRLYGAWKSNETLINHGLLGRQQGRKNYGARGWQSEKNSYFLTREGEKFIEALFKLKPEVRQQVQQSASPVASLGDAWQFGSVAAASSPLQRRASQSSVFRGRGANADDRRRLIDFANTASLGDTLVFDVTKDRRKSLHDLTDKLNVQTMAAKGLRLAHESHGVGRGRKLTIRVERNGGGGMNMFNTPTKRAGSIFEVTPNLSDDVGYSPPRPMGVGRTLEAEYGSPPKRARGISTRDAAAEAAELRRAKFESLQDAKHAKMGSADQPFSLDSDYEDYSDETDKKPRALPINRSQSSRSDAVVLVEDVKPPAASAVAQSTSQRKRATKPTLTSHEIDLLLSSDEDEDEEEPLKPIFTHRKPGNKSDVIDLISPGGDASSGTKKLQIFIDDRERTRNAQPRYLRMQLNELLSSSIFKAIQPGSLKETSVVEKTLAVGDFGFQVTGESGHDTIGLPLCIERKRIGDLVQRSASKDHWRQLLRGQESSLVNVLLLEGDFRSAQGFVPFGAGGLDEAWSPRRHVISDESSLLISLARAVLSIHNLRLIQTKDEQGSLRAVAAYGTVASFSSLADSSKQIPTFGSITDEKHRLSDCLVDGGIPPGLAHIVAEEVGSLQALKRLYSLGESQECNDQLLVPLISGFCEPQEQDAISWSTAIHTVIFSASSDVSKTKEAFIEHKHLVSDEAHFLALLHQAKPVEKALDEVYASDGDVRVVPRRVVRIQHTPDLAGCFPQGNVDGAFYRLREVTELLGNKLPRVRMWTETEDFRSEFLDLSLIDGPPFVDTVVEEMTRTGDSLTATRQAASRIHRQLSDRTTKNVLLIRGLRPAMDRVAKGAGYRPETPLVVDMVCAELSITHGLIVFQAVRKTGDTESFVRDCAFACFHYQLLTRKRPNVFPVL